MYFQFSMKYIEKSYHFYVFVPCDVISLTQKPWYFENGWIFLHAVFCFRLIFMNCFYPGNKNMESPGHASSPLTAFLKIILACVRHCLTLDLFPYNKKFSWLQRIGKYVSEFNIRVLHNCCLSMLNPLELYENTHTFLLWYTYEKPFFIHMNNERIQRHRKIHLYLRIPWINIRHTPFWYRNLISIYCTSWICIPRSILILISFVEVLESSHPNTEWP